MPSENYKLTYKEFLKIVYMNKVLTVLTGLALFLASCGSSSVNKEDNTPEGKKKQLAALKEQQDKLNKQITSLEKSLGDSAKEKAKLVTLTSLEPTSFTHYIDLQGDVEAENMSWVSPRGQGGVVR